MSVVFVNTLFARLKLSYTNNTQGFSKEKYAKFNLAYNVGDKHLAVEKIVTYLNHILMLR